MSENAVDPGVPGIEVHQGVVAFPDKRDRMVELDGVGKVPMASVKEVEYYPNGAVRAVRFWGEQAKKKEAE